MLRLGLGVTNLVPRATARADELAADELRTGGRRLVADVETYGPRWVAVVGITAYRTAFAAPRAVLGPQERRIGAARVWVLPNPSGLNAHYTLDALAERFAGLRSAVTEGETC